MALMADATPNIICGKYCRKEFGLVCQVIKVIFPEIHWNLFVNVIFMSTINIQLCNSGVCVCDVCLIAIDEMK